MLVAAFGLGVGFGVVVVEINVLFADGFGERATAMLNLLGACFGAGAVLGPLAVAATGGYRVPFCAGALLAVVALALTRDLPATTRLAAPAEGGRRRGGRRVRGPVRAVRWRGERDRRLGDDQPAGRRDRRGRGGQLDGRLLGGPHRRAAAGHPAGPADIRAGAGRRLAAVAAAGLALAHVPALAPAAYTLTGLALGPVFPTALAWLAQAAPGARGSTATVFAAANLGGVVLPVVIGRLVDAGSPAVIPTIVLGVALACLAATLALRVRLAPPVPERS